MNIGIVGSEAAKFTEETERLAKYAIRDAVAESAGVPMGGTISPQTLAGQTIVSGACHLGGIDIWAEEFADEMELEKLIFPPKVHSWESGYKPRNIQIAKHSDIVYVVTLRELPQTYRGMRFNGCYHCDKRKKLDRMLDQEYRHRANLPHASGYEQEHVKSGACWTAWYAVEKFGKNARWIII